MRRLAGLVGLVLLVPAVAHGRVAVGPSNSMLPSISGNPTPHGTVTADPGQWSGSGTITFGYQWEQCDAAGGACHLLPYQSQTVSDLAVGGGGSLRVVVTATDSTGSATATSGPVAIINPSSGNGGAVTLTLLLPKPGAVIVGSSVAVKVAASSKPAFTPDSSITGTFTQAAAGTWTAKGRIAGVDAGRLAWKVSIGHTVKTSFVRHYLRRWIVVSGDGPTDDTLGCNPCKLRDVAGDAHGGADITSVVASATKTAFTVVVTTPNGWSHSAAVCFEFSVPRRSSTPGHGGGTDGCFGPKINNGSLAADIPVQVSHPSATTTKIVSPLAPLRRSPIYELGTQRWLLLQIWSSGAGDATFDVFPGTKLDPRSPKIKLQLTRDP